MSRYRYFTVKGQGNFPFIMLHRDECFPASPVDAEKILMSCPTVTDRPYEIRLATYKSHPNEHGWFVAKWPIQRVE